MFFILRFFSYYVQRNSIYINSNFLKLAEAKSLSHWASSPLSSKLNLRCHIDLMTLPKAGIFQSVKAHLITIPLLGTQEFMVISFSHPCLGQH